jgi:hypothetical protein
MTPQERIAKERVLLQQAIDDNARKQAILSDELRTFFKKVRALEMEEHRMRMEDQKTRLKAHMPAPTGIIK